MRTDALYLALGTVYTVVGLAMMLGGGRGAWRRARMRRQAAPPAPEATGSLRDDPWLVVGPGALMVSTGIIVLLPPTYWGWALLLDVPFLLVLAVWLVMYFRSLLG